MKVSSIGEQRILNVVTIVFTTLRVFTDFKRTVCVRDTEPDI